MNKRISCFPLFKFLGRERKKEGGVGKSVLFVHSFLSLLLFHTGNVPEARSELWVNSMCTHSRQLIANHLAASLFSQTINPLGFCPSLVTGTSTHFTSRHRAALQHCQENLPAQGTKSIHPSINCYGLKVMKN